MTLRHPKLHPHIWDSYLQKYKRYALDTIIIKSRSEVKVTVTRKWYTTFHHRKMLPHTKSGIPISNNKRYAHDTIIIKTRSKVKITATRKWYVTLRHPKIHIQTKLEIPTSKSIRYMLQTQ